MEEDCRGGQGLNWAVEPKRESDKCVCKFFEVQYST
jgi:hypothetical protein